MSRIFSTRMLSRTAAILLLAGALAACGTNTPSTPTIAQQPTASVPTSAPTIAATATAQPAPTAEPTVAATATTAPAPTAEPTAEPSSVVFTSASKIPVQIEHPNGWTVADFGDRQAPSHVGLPEQSLEISGPDADTSLIVRYYDYIEPGRGDVTGAYVAIQFNESIDRTTVKETSDDNGNIEAEWTYTDATSKKPTHALVRFIHNDGSPYTYAILFHAPEDQFAELMPVGRAMIDSFQEQE